jgi:hypothetical protein
MVITDFKINISDVTPRPYKPRMKKVKPGVEITPRKMFSFTFEYQGLIEGHDPLNEESYIGAEHKGCMFYHCGYDRLDWGFAKTTTFKGHQIQPSKPNVGLRKVVLAALMKTRWAEELLEDAAAAKAAQIPDPEQPEKESLVIS